MVFLKACTYSVLILTVFVNCCCAKGTFNTTVYDLRLPLAFKIDCFQYNIAILELETSGVLYVCLGGTLSVKCSTSADILRWTVNVSRSQTPRVLRRGVTKLGTADTATTIPTTLTTLYVSRSLNESSSLPLMSTLSTDNATADLNETTITCSADMAGQSLANASLLIILARNISGNINCELFITYGMILFL